MDATTALAIYAAVVSTGLLIVAVATYRANRTRVEVQVNPGEAKIWTELDDGFGNKIEAPGEVVFFHLTNKSAHAVKIASIGAARRKGGGFVAPRPYPVGYPLPLEIPARDSRTLWIERKGLDESEPMRYFARTTAGETFETKALRIEEQQRWTLHDG